MYNRLWIYKKWYLPLVRKRHLTIYLEQVASGKKPLFIHVNRTAGSSIAAALGISAIHKTLQEYEILFQAQFKEPLSKSTQVVVSIRNPFDKVASQYYYRCETQQNNLHKRKLDFNQWVLGAFSEKRSDLRDREIMFQSQSDWIRGYEAYPTHFIRFESLEKDYAEIAEKFDGDPLPWKKRSGNENYRSLYSQQSIDSITSEFSEDLEKFKYQF